MLRLWHLDPASVSSTPARLAQLSPDEQAQYARFIPDRKRHEYLCTRLLVRHVLGDARLIINEWGRPLLADQPRHFFNLTHTDGLILLLESDEFDVGVDTELISRAPTLLRLAPNVFAEAEFEALRALPEGEQPFRAVTLWTLKESYIKARGMGLALGLKGFAFRFEPDGVTRLDVAPALNDSGAHWQFQTFALGPHLVSTALRHPASEPRVLERREVLLP